MKYLSLPKYARQSHLEDIVSSSKWKAATLYLFFRDATFDLLRKNTWIVLSEVFITLLNTLLIFWQNLQNLPFEKNQIIKSKCKNRPLVHLFTKPKGRGTDSQAFTLLNTSFVLHILKWNSYSIKTRSRRIKRFTFYIKETSNQLLVPWNFCL